MGSTRSFPGVFSIFLFVFSLFSFPLYGQSGGGVLVGTEIQNIEKTLGSSSLSGPRRHEALVKLARLYELSGNIEGAARAWTGAAAAEPGNRDDLALIRGASCYAAMGEWEKAEEAVKTALLTGDKQILIRARLLGAQIGAFRAAAAPPGSAGGSSAGSAVLSSLLEDPDYAAFKPSIYYILWKTSSADIWKTRLIAEYPRSPEGRIAAAAGTAAEPGAAVNTAGAVSAAPTAMWLLIPGRESISTERSGSAGIAAAASSAPAPAPVPGTAPAAPSAPGAAAGTNPANTGAVLQTGFFSVEGNARAMAERLKKAGFTPTVSRRAINGREGWVVNVPAGSDAGAAINKLKNAGFESLLVN